jgi:hypothetical protein
MENSIFFDKIRSVGEAGLKSINKKKKNLFGDGLAMTDKNKPIHLLINMNQASLKILWQLII